MLKQFLFFIVLVLTLSCQSQHQLWVEYKGKQGAGTGKHIVLVSGDEEYRSEESLPMLAQILAEKHGFNCTVLFSIDPSNGSIDAYNKTNIPGLEKLQQADLLLIATRFRELPDNQMKFIDQYVQAGKPIIALRTATHAFNYEKNKKSPYAKYSFDSKVKGWEGGFGKKILGETWVAHHGHHGQEGTRAITNGIVENKKNPLLNGVKDIWGPSDVYTTKQLANDTEVLLYGLSTNGMSATDPVNLNKSVMPVAWTKTYAAESGKQGKVLTTTMGAAVDLLSEDLRRLIVNGCYWATGLSDKIPTKADVGFITPFNPTMFGFDSFIKGTYPEKYNLK